MLRRLKLGLFLTATVAVAGCGGAHRPAPRRAPVRPPTLRPRVPTLRRRSGARVSRPNVVFVLTDDLSKDLVRDMPHVRALRRSGATFSRYVVSDSLCCPSRASILTGRLPHDTGVFTNTRPEGGYAAFIHHRDGRATFAGALSARGYRTALMGKYLNGYPPGHGGIPPGWTDWAGTGKAYAEYGYRLDEQGTPVSYGTAPGDYLTDVLARRGEAYVDAAAGSDQPFVLELATFAPHRPAVPAPRDLHALPHDRAPRGPAYDRANRDAPPWLAGRRAAARPHAPLDRPPPPRPGALACSPWTACSRGSRPTSRADGLDRDTYVVFSSDNGFHMGEHRLLPGKLTAFDTDVRVPLIVAGPGIRPGSTDRCPGPEHRPRADLRGAGRRARAAAHGRPQPRPAAARPHAGELAHRGADRAPPPAALGRRPGRAGPRQRRPADLRGAAHTPPDLRRVRRR